MIKNSQIYTKLKEKMDNKETIPIIIKNGIEVHQLTVFEEVVLRNMNNLKTIAIEINGNSLTYEEFFMEVEKYMILFKKMGLQEHDVVSLCLPVSVEFICSYYALTTLGITCNALNIMFLLSHGIKPYLDERCSELLICYDKYYKMLLEVGSFSESKIKTVILAGDETYTHMSSDSDKVQVPNVKHPNINVITFTDFLCSDITNTQISSVVYNEQRISTLNYTSGTTGLPKCMAHSDLAPLFLIASHDHVKRDEYIGERTLLTIPLQHPTGLFYAMVLQMAEGKTLVLEPIYDKKLFAEDIKKLHINHAVQAKPFYAQLIQDRADGILRPGDFELFKHPYSGGEGVPFSVCRQINETLAYAGCKNTLLLGYGRSEEGSSTIAPYNMLYRENTVGVSLPGIKAKLVSAQTLNDIPMKPGVKGEILVSTPVMPIGHCYLDKYNKMGISDGSIIDNDGVRWARPRDIAECVELSDGKLSFNVLGRADDCVYKGEKIYYLFEVKEQISSINGIQECEVLATQSGKEELITVHCVLNDQINNEEIIVKKIFQTNIGVDGVKFYDSFGINATSGKCDREAMCREKKNFYVYVNDRIIKKDFI